MTSGFVYIEPSFPGKLLDELLRLEIAWGCGNGPNEREWIAVHPRMDEAIMSTIAVAIASDFNFAIVTSRDHIHRSLISRDPGIVYNAQIRGQWCAGLPDKQTITDELAQVIVVNNFKLDALSADTIAKISQEGGNLSKFREELQKLAQTAQRVGSQQARKADLEGLAGNIMDKWQTDKRYMSKFARDF